MISLDLISTTISSWTTNSHKYFILDLKAAAEDQGNSVYDFFVFSSNNYSTYEPCYDSAINYLKQLYKQYEPCQGYFCL